MHPVTPSASDLSSKGWSLSLKNGTYETGVLLLAKAANLGEERAQGSLVAIDRLLSGRGVNFLDSKQDSALAREDVLEIVDATLSEASKSKSSESIETLSAILNRNSHLLLQDEFFEIYCDFRQALPGKDLSKLGKTVAQKFAKDFNSRSSDTRKLDPDKCFLFEDESGSLLVKTSQDTLRFLQRDLPKSKLAQKLVEEGAVGAMESPGKTTVIAGKYVRSHTAMFAEPSVADNSEIASGGAGGPSSGGAYGAPREGGSTQATGDVLMTYRHDRITAMLAGGVRTRRGSASTSPARSGGATAGDAQPPLTHSTGAASGTTAGGTPSTLAHSAGATPAAGAGFGRGVE